MQSQASVRVLVAAVFGSLTTVGVSFFNVPVWVAAVAGGVANFSVGILWKEKPKPQLLELSAKVNEVLVAATERVNSLEASAQKVPPKMLVKISLIVSTARALIRDLRQKPNDIEVGQRFFTHYLDSTQTVITSYRHLVERKSGQITPEVEAKMLELLTSVEKNFAQQKENLLAGEVLRLKTEMEVLQRSMEMERS